MTSKDLRDILLLGIFVLGTGFGAALVINVAIGVSAWDGLTQSLAETANIQIGTMGMILNLFFMIMQFIILKKEMSWTTIFQIPMTLLLGVVVNFVYYDLLANFKLEHYALQVVFFIIGQIFIAGSVGAIMVIDKVVFPLEGFCMALAKKSKFSFVKIRQAVDVVSVILALIIFIIFKGTLTVREGTIIGMLFFSPMVGMFMNLWRPLLKPRIID